ncbi:hypothetical protein C2G38_2112989 [Gigaspora rosea]|uniref:Uncharacterized protein n=1 Tax=Gigaspora rosea TaxID=44941 RepID=A0A397UK22_9GLOM|nr:hypothetical protein C2G38_2112989 [Gigaspora rosea]
MYIRTYVRSYVCTVHTNSTNYVQYVVLSDFYFMNLRKFIKFCIFNYFYAWFGLNLYIYFLYVW